MTTSDVTARAFRTSVISDHERDIRQYRMKHPPPTNARPGIRYVLGFRISWCLIEVILEFFDDSTCDLLTSEAMFLNRGQQFPRLSSEPLKIAAVGLVRIRRGNDRSH